MEKGAGIYREEPLLTEGAAKLRELQERYADINLDDRSRTFNTELESALELGFMLDVAESMVQCALHRTESRGAHQRTDYPEPGRREVSGAFAGVSQPGRLVASGVSAGDDHALAAGRAGLRRSKRRRRRVNDGETDQSDG